MKEFIKYITEDQFSDKTLDELMVLLKHHQEDLEEYKDSDITAYEATKKDIAEIEKAIEKLKGE